MVTITTTNQSRNPKSETKKSGNLQQSPHYSRDRIRKPAADVLLRSRNLPVPVFPVEFKREVAPMLQTSQGPDLQPLHRRLGTYCPYPPRLQKVKRNGLLQGRPKCQKDVGAKSSAQRFNH